LLLKYNLYPLKSLYGKVALAVSVILLIFFSIFVVIAKKTGKDLLNQLMLVKAHSVLDLTENTIAKIMIEGKGHGLQNLAEGVLKSVNIKDVYIMDNDGKIVLDAKKKSVGQVIPVHSFISTNNIHNTRYQVNIEQGIYSYKIIHPIFKRPECHKCHQSNSPTIGYLMMTVSMEDIQQSAAAHQKSNIILVVSTLFGTGLILLITLSIAVVRPVKNLSKAMQAVSSSIHKIGKQEKDRVEFNPVVRTSDEIGQLQKNLSELVDELNRANQQIKEMHVSQMVRADQLANVGEMAASIAHEIRNPVAGVQGALEIIKSEIQHDEPRKEIIEEMQTQLKRVNKAITDLLSYARPSAPHFVISDLSNLTRKTASLLTRQTQEKKINLQILNVTEIPDIFIDEKLIQQVFFNIIMNAIDAVKEDGRIQIYLSSIDDRVVIKFSNNGEAIPENKRESIFKPFFTTKHKGTGLGLAISKKIIEQHNGTIRLDTTLNTGTTFIIELPTKQG
jgi:signal transduction histidine kinase